MNKLDYLHAMQNDGLIDPASFDLRAKDPEALVANIGAFVEIGYEIEGDTASTADTVRLLAPGPHVDIWEGQELWHSLTYAAMAEANDIALPNLSYNPPDSQIQTVGRIVARSSVAAELFGQVVGIEGYKNERQNMAAQRRASIILKKSGETKIAEAFEAMYRQEAFHAAYYWHDLQERRVKHPLLYRLAKGITSIDPKPIGANTPERIIRVGAAMKSLFETEEVTQLVDRTAKLLDFNAKQTKKQHEAIAQCIEAFEEAA